MNNTDSSLAGSDKTRPWLVVGALGVVFGDIGTSPLYALQSCFFGLHRLALTPENIIGVTSAVLWTLILVVTVKYVFVVLRADHRGEGGILALTTLADRGSHPTQRRLLFTTVSIVGASLLFSDGIITPAISVLSAVEGLNAVTPHLTPFVVPVALAVLAFLFLIQSKGTGRISFFYGPVMFLWFAVLGVLGAAAVLRYPGILPALNPLSALRFFADTPRTAFFILGSVFLAVTGAEVLYTDIGHFGKRPIRIAWLLVAFPALCLNYLGQSARLLCAGPGDAPLFYAVVPQQFLIPMVVLSTAATVIASQAVISGMFSLARQAVRLGFWPRLRQIHTSAALAGQVYVPFINGMLFLGAVGLVLFFGKSARLASAYGIAVSVDMLITTCLITYLAWTSWTHGRWIAVGMVVLFLPFDLGFFSANVFKIASGGWIVIVFSAILYLIMSTWRKGRLVLHERSESQSLAAPLFVSSVRDDKPIRVPGVAVFLSGSRGGTPRSLLHNFKHNKIIHETVLIVTVVFDEVPYVEADRRLRYEALGEGIHSAELHYGFFENADVPAALARFPIPGIQFKAMNTTYFLGRESLVVTPLPTMASWRKRVFRFLSMNALDASEYFRLPPNRVVEIGLQVEL